MSIDTILENLWVLLAVAAWVAQNAVRRRRREAQRDQRTDIPPFEMEEVLLPYEEDEEPLDELEEAPRFVEEAPPEPSPAPEPAVSRAVEAPEPSHHEEHHREGRGRHRKTILPCDPESLRRAIVLAEILDKPKALRGAAFSRGRVLG